MGNSELALEKAKLLTAAGQSASDLIVALVNSPKSNDSTDIGYATDALRLAVAEGLWPLIEDSLGHRFADVRRIALDALAARAATSPLPASILALAADKSSGVRRALVAILKDRPAVQHLDALVTLVADDWSDRRSYYGQDTNYPIAQAACEVLAEPPPLPARVIEPLIEIGTKTQDPDVRWNLIGAIARNGGAKGRERVCDLALSREDMRLSTAAAWALYAAAADIEDDTAARLTTEQVTKRSAAVSVTAAMAIGACTGHDHVIETARALSVLPKRRALIVPLLIGACKQNIALVVAVAKFLPPDREVAVIDAVTNGTKLKRTAFDDLADVRIVEEMLRRLGFLFLPKPKRV